MFANVIVAAALTFTASAGAHTEAPAAITVETPAFGCWIEHKEDMPTEVIYGDLALMPVDADHEPVPCGQTYEALEYGESVAQRAVDGTAVKPGFYDRTDYNRNGIADQDEAVAFERATTGK